MENIYYEVPVTVKLGEIARHCNCKLVGNADTPICGVGTLKSATNGQLSFLGNRKYLSDLSECKAAAVIINEEYIDHVPNGLNVLLSNNVMVAYAHALEILYQTQLPYIKGKISDTAKIGKNASIGVNTTIGDFVSIEDGVTIGDDCVIDSFVKIGKNVTIGNNCNIASHVSIKCAVIGNGVSIHAGARIGEPGFGIVPDGHKMVKIKQLGRVIIGNNVRIGANTTIDRGAIEDTVIGDETIIDNLVQIGHNVKVGKLVTLVAQVGIAGSSEIKDGAVLAGQVGVAGHITIGQRAVVAAKAGVISSIKDGAVVSGMPAVDVMTWRRQAAFLKMSVTKKESKKES